MRSRAEQTAEQARAAHSRGATQNHNFDDPDGHNMEITTRPYARP
ncbi:hypothetical protein P2Q00_14410 [Streptomyces coacervatus]|nr:hypothetical protein [Streptomyces coacervatus]MDF2266614.1 hypothetical protein [Streptomyces coacervatus]